MKLQNIEIELKNLLEKDKHHWTKTAQLLIEIERNTLYREKAKSFSQYIRQLSEQFKIHESNFWRIKKAGEYYLKLNTTTDTTIINQAKTTPEQIEILVKINTIAPPAIVKNLEQKMIAGKTTREELRDIWQTYRPLKKGKTERGRRKPKNKKQYQLFNDTNIIPDNEPLTAVNILEALKNPKWANDTINTNTTQFQIYKEVAVTVGTSQHARRIDVVGIIKEQNSLPTVIGVEIKASINDIQRDTKLTEYMPFCHYFYIAVPNETAFIDTAKAVITQQIGLLCITDEVVDGRYQVVMLKQAQRSEPHPIFLGELYGKCLCHALGW